MADYKPLICNQCLLQEDDALCKLSYQGWYLITGNLIRTNNFIILNIINKAPALKGVFQAFTCNQWKVSKHTLDNLTLIKVQFWRDKYKLENIEFVVST